MGYKLLLSSMILVISRWLEFLHVVLWGQSLHFSVLRGQSELQLQLHQLMFVKKAKEGSKKHHEKCCVSSPTLQIKMPQAGVTSQQRYRKQASGQYEAIYPSYSHSHLMLEWTHIAYCPTRHMRQKTTWLAGQQVSTATRLPSADSGAEQY